MTSSTFTVKWGIMATGGIAETFAKDLLTDPAIRDVNDVQHEVVAAASSTSADRAAAFLNKIDAPNKEAKAYGSYAELVADPDVDIVYIATPHSHHFQNAMLALEAGKHVLCEKALTVTAAQTRKMIETAEAKKLFLMEAVWTRYFPLSVKIRDLIKSGAIGSVHRVMADFSFNNSAADGGLGFDNGNRMVNPDLAGGALLDLGIYSLTWVFQTLYHTQAVGAKEKPTVTANVMRYDVTGTDETTTVLVGFPKHKAVGVAMTSLRVASDVDGKWTAGPTIRIQGSGGEIAVYGVAAKPFKFHVLRKGQQEPEVVECPFPKDEKRGGWGHGMYWEADEAARCLRDGKLESKGLPHEESIVIMEVMEETLRQGGVKYPELITSDVYDPKSPLNTGKA
ncbi:hypothetical protein PspLS_01501 [Pyricularia sp. CBS 133598]|nr:hypothetical protein PspLS_01501 [Pyricularia sp. CBS 133598]